ncbi:MAG: glycosyltransferase [Anaerolineaceae bacterium]|nr:glycosyltransferase [Anaerolineaceae bacterium]
MNFPDIKNDKVKKQKRLTVCYFGTYRSEYSRNRIMIKGLLKNEVNVIECHEKLWEGIEDRVNAVKYGLINPKFWKRIITTYIRLFRKFKTIPVSNYDVIVVGYPGQFDVFFAKLFTLFIKKPIVWDVFMSIYLVAIERNLHRKNPFSVKLLKIIEYVAMRIPEKLIIDTEQYATWLNKQYSIPIDKFCLVPTGADDDIFFLEQFSEYVGNEKFKILYYGTFIPNHGVPYIVEAANLLTNDPSIIFQFIGNGPEMNICLDLIEKFKLKNIEFYPWMGQEELKNYIREADVILGAFGKTPQSLMTIQNKIYEGMALGKCIISGDSEAVRNILKNKNEITLTDRNNPESLKEAICLMKENSNLINQISRNAFLTFNRNYTISLNGLRMKNCLKNLTM